MQNSGCRPSSCFWLSLKTGHSPPFFLFFPGQNLISSSSPNFPFPPTKHHSPFSRPWLKTPYKTHFPLYSRAHLQPTNNSSTTNCREQEQTPAVTSVIWWPTPFPLFQPSNLHWTSILGIHTLPTKLFR